MNKKDQEAEILKAMMATPKDKPVNTLEQAMAKKAEVINSAVVSGPYKCTGQEAINPPESNFQMQALPVATPTRAVQIADLGLQVAVPAAPEYATITNRSVDKAVAQQAGLLKKQTAEKTANPDVNFGKCPVCGAKGRPLWMHNRGCDLCVADAEPMTVMREKCEPTERQLHEWKKPKPPMHGSKAILKVGDVVLAESANVTVTTAKHLEPYVIGRAGLVDMPIAGKAKTINSDGFHNPCNDIDVISPEQAFKRDLKALVDRYSQLGFGLDAAYLMERTAKIVQHVFMMTDAEMVGIMKKRWSAQPPFLAEARLLKTDVERDAWNGGYHLKMEFNISANSLHARETYNQLHDQAGSELCAAINQVIVNKMGSRWPKGFSIEGRGGASRGLVWCIVKGLNTAEVSAGRPAIYTDMDAHIWLEKQRRNVNRELASFDFIARYVEELNNVLYGNLTDLAKEQLTHFLKTGTLK